jgi:archaellum component FlaC
MNEIKRVAIFSVIFFILGVLVCGIGQYCYFKSQIKEYNRQIKQYRTTNVKLENAIDDSRKRNKELENTINRIRKEFIGITSTTSRINSIIERSIGKLSSIESEIIGVRTDLENIYNARQ